MKFKVTRHATIQIIMDVEAPSVTMALGKAEKFDPSPFINRSLTDGTILQFDTDAAENAEIVPYDFHGELDEPHAEYVEEADAVAIRRWIGEHTP